MISLACSLSNLAAVPAIAAAPVSNNILTKANDVVCYDNGVTAMASVLATTANRVQESGMHL